MFDWFRKRPPAVAAPSFVFPYPFEFVPGEQALERVLALRAAGDGVPVILGGRDDLERFAQQLADKPADPERALAIAATIDPVEWLAERAEDEPGQFAIDAAPWPEDAAVHDTLTVAGPELCIAILPAQEAWQAACFLDIGGWNAMPGDCEHAALWRLWEARYGARVAHIGHDTIEFTVDRPPRTREDALALARQQFVYCDDIVHQGIGSVEALAATILDGHAWFFWWD